MTTKQFIKQRNILLKDAKMYQHKMDMKYTKLVQPFIAKNSPVIKNKVYELVENGVRRRGLIRFVIYDLQVKWFVGNPTIHACGWWLNKDDVPTKWDSMTVFGVGNPAKFILSKNQTNKKHPKAN